MVTVAHEHRSVHKLTARKRHFVRRRSHSRHRLRAPLFASVPVPSPPGFEMPKPDDAAKYFVFTVEGDVSLANYDALTKTIDTYEGESFALDQTPTGSSEMAWQDNPPNIHYRCDQSGNCDLVSAGQAFLNSKRTK
jgi:hypothetical protein